jgi:mannosyltransferase
VAPLIVLGAGQKGQLRIIELTPQRMSDWFDALWTLKFIGLLVMGVFLAYALFARTRQNMLRLWAWLPPALFLLSYPLLHVFRPRYFVFTLPAWALLAACSLEPAPARAKLRGVVTAVTLIAMIGLGFHWQVASRTSLARVEADYRGAARQLRLEARPGDAIDFSGMTGPRVHARLGLNYELRRGPRLREIFAAESMRERGRLSPRDCPEPAKCLSDSVTRLWLVAMNPKDKLYKDIPRARARLLQRRFELRGLKEHSGLTLALFTRKRERRKDPAVSHAKIVH